MNLQNGTVRTIIKWPNPTLSRKSLAYDAHAVMFPDFGNLVRDMVATMLAAKGVGLSAIQIGACRRVIVLNAGNGIEVLANPVITKRLGQKKLVSEGCLSLPGIFEQVERYPTVVVEALNENGQPVTLTMEGLRAQAAQHEIEHLDGIVFVDKLPSGKKDEIRSRLRTFNARGWSKTREFEPREERGRGDRRPRRDDREARE